MKNHFFPVVFLSLFFVWLPGCGRTKFVNTAKLPDTYRCRHMKEVCKEASTFESEYSKLSEEERKDAESVLKAYRMQCNDALKMCEESGEEK